MDDFKRASRLDQAEQSLYSPNAEIKQKPRKKMYQEESDLPNDWVDEVNKDVKEENPLKKENKKGFSVFTKIFIVALIFFIGALSYAFFIFNFKSNPDAQNVDITINSPVSVAAGEEFTFDVIIENDNAVSMNQIDLAIEYPEGTRKGDDVSVSLPRERSDIGNIDSGSFQRETRTVFLFGEEGDTKEIEVKIVYRVPDSNAVFEKRKVFDVVLKSTPVRMNVSSVREITAGQGLEFDIELISNSNEDLNNVLVKADYPFGFMFTDSTLPTSSGNTTWLINKIEPKEKIQFTVRGEMQGQNNEVKYFKFDSGLMSDEKEDEISVLFTSVGKSIAIQRPFLEIDLAVEGDNSSVINLNSNKNQRMKVSYKNNTGEPINDVEVTLQLEGDVLDQSSVRATGGFYNSNNNTIVWNRSTYDAFDKLGVGEGGNLELSFSSKSLTSDERFKNPEIALSAKVVGKRIQENDVPEEIINEVFKTIRFNTVVGFENISLYYDGPFENKGEIPPKVGVENTYTISLGVYNSSNRISNGLLQMRLPTYVNYVGQTWPSGANISYDSRDKVVTWNIGEIKENTGYDGEPMVVAFQVSIVPSLSQRNSEPILIDDVLFTGTDLFTGEQVKISGADVTTAISDSRGFYDGQVSQ